MASRVMASIVPTPRPGDEPTPALGTGAGNGAGCRFRNRDDYPQVGLVRLLHSRPVLQVRFEQQGWPSPPQVWQVSGPVRAGAQTVPAVVHRLFAQQGSWVLPQATHSLPLHTTLPAVQRSFEQHRSPTPPQRIAASPWPETHAPAEQVRSAPPPELAQACPAPAQVPPPAEVQQQPPFLHRLPEQHASPAAPQT